MIRVPLLGYEGHWQNEVQLLQAEYKDLIKQHPASRDATEEVHRVLNDTVSLVGCTLMPIGKSED